MAVTPRPYAVSPCALSAAFCGRDRPPGDPFRPQNRCVTGQFANGLAGRGQPVDLVELVRLCHDLGGRVLVFGSPKQRSLLPGVTPEQASDHIYEVFSRLVPVLEATDTVVALEPLSPVETDVLTTAAETCRLIERIGSPHVRLHLDVKAMASEETPIPEIIVASARHLEHFHANDVNLQGPGFGAVDFAPIFGALDEVRYAGWVSVEVFDYAPGPERLARESIAYMSRVEADLG